MERIKDLLCKTCISSASGKRCANCSKAIKKLNNKRRLKALADNKARNEKYWLSPKSKHKRLLRHVNNLTIEQLASLDTTSRRVKKNKEQELIEFILNTNLKESDANKP